MTLRRASAWQRWLSSSVKRSISDVVIDMLCYRRRGHNEADDPSLTQPLMYERIDEKRSVRKRYTESLIGRGDISVEEAEQALAGLPDQLERGSPKPGGAEAWRAEVDPTTPTSRPGHAPRRSSDETVERIVDSQTNLPEEFPSIPASSHNCSVARRW